MSIEESLLDFTADLVTEVKNAEFLQRLFTLTSGDWIWLARQSEGMDSPLVVRDQSLPDDLRVTWVDLPDSLHGDEFCLIVFYAESIFWSNVILYNRGLFRRREQA